MRQLRLAMVAACLSGILQQTANAAVYEVIEMPTQEIAQHSFSASINNSGDVVLLTDEVFNPPIDLSLLNFESTTLVDNLTDIDAAQNGNFNAVDLQFLSDFIQAQSLETFQKLTRYQSFLVSGNEASFITGFDTIDPELDTYARDTNTYVREINDAGVIVGLGDGPTRKVVYTNESEEEITYVVQDFNSRGFVQLNGLLVELVPESDLPGSISEATDVNNNLLVSGYEATEVTEARQNSIDNCEDDEIRGDIPVDLCFHRLIRSGVSGAFQRRGALWQLNEAGDILSKKTLGIHFTPDEDDDNTYISRALAVNDNGIAVGDASKYFDSNENIIGMFAAVFKDDEVIGFTDDSEYNGSVAVDINNNNLVVGQASKTISGYNRTKFFIYDVDNEVVTYPVDFFPGSASVAHSINDNNLVVGEGEVDAGLSVSRRKHGFIYDVAEQTFQDLNDLLACDSPYTIVQANSINNSNQIAATAIVNRASYNIKGEAVLDDNGDPVTEDVAVSIILNPVSNGNIEDCAPDEQDVQERSGGSMYWLLPLMLLGLFRRRK